MADSRGRYRTKGSSRKGWEWKGGGSARASKDIKAVTEKGKLGEGKKNQTIMEIKQP